MELRRPPRILMLRPRASDAFRNCAQVVKSTHGKVEHARTRRIQVEVLCDILQILRSRVKKLSDEGLSGVVA